MLSENGDSRCTFRNILFAILVTVLSGCGDKNNTATDTPKINHEDIRALDNIYRKWTDADQLAGATSRIALAGPVGNLQAILRETESLQVSDCAAKAKSKLVEGMNLRLKSYLAFMISIYEQIRVESEWRGNPEKSPAHLFELYEEELRVCDPSRPKQAKSDTK